jgi:sulfotransferase 6B1
LIQNHEVSLPKVLVNSLPKSGTHLLLQLILGIPGMTITPAWIVEDNDITMIKSGSVGPAHLVHSENRVQLLEENNIKVVFISRDLRDVVVSLVHFVMLNKWGNHPWTPYLKKLKTHDERLMAMINGVNFTQEEQEEFGIASIPNIREFAKNKLGWRQEPHICSVTFEELVSNNESRNQSINKIIQFLWDDLKHLNMTKQELLEIINAAIIPENSGTFRKGRIGDWQEEFNNDHKTAFKNIAGDLLIQQGYEQNDQW